MKAKDFVLEKYPDAVAFRWIYDNRLRRPTWCITKGNSFNVYFYNPKGSDTQSAAWVFAKKEIMTGNPSNLETN